MVNSLETSSPSCYLLPIRRSHGVKRPSYPVSILNLWRNEKQISHSGFPADSEIIRAASCGSFEMRLYSRSCGIIKPWSECPSDSTVSSPCLHFCVSFGSELKPITSFALVNALHFMSRSDCWQVWLNEPKLSDLTNHFFLSHSGPTVEDVLDKKSSLNMLLLLRLAFICPLIYI